MSEPAPYLVAELREALAIDPRVGQLDVHVTMAGGGKVFLDGNVPTAQCRDVISEVAARVLAGYEVHNQMRVPDLSETDDAEALP